MPDRPAWKKQRFGVIALAVTAVALIAAIGLSRGGPPAPAPTPTKTPDAPETTIKDLEARMRAQPDDGKGWQELGAAYFAAERYTDAAGAYARATRIDPKNADIWSALGEAQTLATNAVDPVAHDAFKKALALDPKDARARYFLGVEKDVRGDHKGAVEDWIALLRDGPNDAPWAQSVHQLVVTVAEKYKIDIKGRLPDVAPAPAGGSGEDAARAAIPGPSSDQIKDAAGMSRSDQDAMARGMVDRLAARLATQPDDLDGWIRLMRARMVLGDTKGAGDALARARQVFGGNASALSRVNDAARTLNVPGA